MTHALFFYMTKGIESPFRRGFQRFHDAVLNTISRPSYLHETPTYISALLTFNIPFQYIGRKTTLHQNTYIPYKNACKHILPLSYKKRTRSPSY